MKYFTALVVLFCTQPVLAEIQKVSLPLEVRSEISSSIDDEIKGKLWNRWVSDNFVVCCLNDTKARYLYQNLESVKKWSLTRWGLADVKFSAECILLGVDDKQFFKKIFGIDHSKVEIRRDANGDITRSVVFLLLDDLPSRTVPEPLTEVCLSEYEQSHHLRLGWWAHRGMAGLNGPLPNIRSQIAGLQSKFQRNEPMYFSKSLFETKEEHWLKEEENRQLFDVNAMCLCLMLRREFGQHKFLSILHAGYNHPEEVLQKEFHFDDQRLFDKSFKRFMYDLSNDLGQGSLDKPITPDSYLQIQPAK